MLEPSKIQMQVKLINKCLTLKLNALSTNIEDFVGSE